MAGGSAAEARNEFPRARAGARRCRGRGSVSFDPSWFYPDNGTGGKVRFEQLEDWSKRPEDGIRYYSGMATYRTTFDVQPQDPASAVYLDLGVVRNVARVRLNGRDLGVVWTAPWRMEITGALKSGANELEIDVANLWPNRLIGDATLPQEQRLTVTNVRTYDTMASGTYGCQKCAAAQADRQTGRVAPVGPAGSGDAASGQNSCEVVVVKCLKAPESTRIMIRSILLVVAVSLMTNLARCRRGGPLESVSRTERQWRSAMPRPYRSGGRRRTTTGRSNSPVPATPRRWSGRNRIFVTCGDPATALRTLLCVDAPTGRTLWRHEEPSKTYDQHRDNCYATETPAVDADGVVIAWSTPEAVMLLALDLQGSELWRRNLGPLVSLQGSGSSPILYQGSGRVDK